MAEKLFFRKCFFFDTTFIGNRLVMANALTYDNKGSVKNVILSEKSLHFLKIFLQKKI